MVRNATRSDATIAKPLIVEVGRISGDNELSVRWAVSSTTDIADYRIQWAPGCMTGWDRRIGAGSKFFTSSGSTDELTAFTPAGGRLRHRAFKVRIRARMAANTATHRKGGPWSDTVFLYQYNPVTLDSVNEEVCKPREQITGEYFCRANIGGDAATVETDASLNLEFVPGGNRAIQNRVRLFFVECYLSHS